MRRKGSKPEESKTVRQWALQGRTPVDGAEPSYIWDVGDHPSTVYFREDDMRDMIESEYSRFLEDKPAYSKRYLDKFSERWKEFKHDR